jgi:adenylylsulfate reductase subunit A
MEIKFIETDVLIIGGGAAGCAAALAFSEKPEISVVVAEKAHIKRSGCLAAGVNALNAYITEGSSPRDYADYAFSDAEGIARYDLLLSAASGFNDAARKLESIGLVILKNPDGSYAARGKRNIKINGENIKPLLAEAVSKIKNVRVINRLNITDFIVDGGAVRGAAGFSLESETIFAISARAVVVATGGASGIYRPNNPGFSRHKMWYPPFNAGAGYAMGIAAGAEMTTFEMRFVALRCKDTIAPTGTLAQGAGARQTNAKGERYEDKYGVKTWERVHGTAEENRAGRGPCYLAADGLSPEQKDQLLKAYLNMAPSQTLRWLETGDFPGPALAEIEGTEPYITGGHTASGYWVDTDRRTTLPGLYAAGDVAGGCPQKYVTGAMAEGAIAASTAGRDIKSGAPRADKRAVETAARNLRAGLARMFAESAPVFTADQIEEAMQTAMDRNAGGISSGYRYSRASLAAADERLRELAAALRRVKAADIREAGRVYETRDRLLTARLLIAHLAARRETRWGVFALDADYPSRDDARFNKFVNSVRENGAFKIIMRDIDGSAERYEH